MHLLCWDQVLLCFSNRSIFPVFPPSSISSISPAHLFIDCSLWACRSLRLYVLSVYKKVKSLLNFNWEASKCAAQWLRASSNKPGASVLRASEDSCGLLLNKADQLITPRQIPAASLFCTIWNKNFIASYFHWLLCHSCSSSFKSTIAGGQFFFLAVKISSPLYLLWLRNLINHF